MLNEKIKIKHKPGRPKKEVKREIIKGVRFTKAEYYLIKRRASEASTPITLYLREMALQGKIISRLNEEERKYARQLIGITNHFDQLTNKGQLDQSQAIVLKVEKYSELIDELLEKLKPRLHD